MKKGNSLKALLAAVLLVLCFSSTALAAPKLNTKTVTLKKGETYTLALKNSSAKASWKTSNKSVAAIKTLNSNKVKITAKKKGTATITAKAGGKNYTCKVTVNNTYSAAKTEIAVKKAAKVRVNFTKTGSSVNYKVADSSIVSCSWGKWYNKNKSIDLNLKGKKNGTTKVTLTNSANKEKIVLNVTVSGFKTTADADTKKDEKHDKPITVAKTNVTIDKEGSIDIGYYGGGTISYSNDNALVLTGKFSAKKTNTKKTLLLTGKKNGTATITLKDSTSGYELEVKVTVTGMDS